VSYRAKNNAYGLLAAGIAAGDTALTLQAGQGDRFPVIVAPDFTKITLENAAGNREIIHLLARAAASDVFTSILRGQEGTTARAWNAGDVVELRMTAALVETAMAHPDNTDTAHHASAITATPSGNLTGDSVEEQLAELDQEKEPAFEKLGFAKGGTNATSRAGAVAALGIEAAEIVVNTLANATTDIGSAAGTNILLTTGATTITGFAAAAAGVSRKVRVSTGGITLTHSATFVLPGAANIVTVAGDCFEAYSTGAGWRIRDYQKMSGHAVVDIEQGTKMLFVQTSAPTGWTKDTTHNDKTLRVVSGTADSGGSVAFSTLFGRTATDGSSLSIAQLAAHTHPAIGVSGSGYGTGASPTGAVSGSTGSNAAHSHGLDMRVQYVDSIIATKN
jgi:hypothetical protein